MGRSIATFGIDWCEGVVPPLLSSTLRFPALKRWARLCCPSGAAHTNFRTRGKWDRIQGMVQKQVGPERRPGPIISHAVELLAGAHWLFAAATASASRCLPIRRLGQAADLHSPQARESG